METLFTPVNGMNLRFERATGGKLVCSALGTLWLSYELES